MAKFDNAPDELALDWGEDTIYCEATCRSEDVLYEGSEDADYDSPTSRRLRYEAAGQRFLNGADIFLLSATLQGPFDKSCDWGNPWRSKYRTADVSRPKEPNGPRFLTSTNRASQQLEIPTSVECHLPSPESLKQVAITEPHAYLEDDELAAVQNWRTLVRPGLGPDEFWTSKSEELTSAKKRKANSSDWLKKSASKRRKADIMETGAVHTPILQRQRASRRLATDRSAALHASFSSAPDRINTPAKRSSSYRQANGLTSSHNGKDVDELMDAAFGSFNSAPVRLSSPTKRISPRRSARKVSGEHGPDVESEDELSQEQAAAATLSSPVSTEGGLRKSSRLKGSSRGQGSVGHKRVKPAKQTKSPKSQPKDSTSAAPVFSDDVVMEDAAGERSLQDLDAIETQQDHSFCYKMRPKANADEQHQGENDAVQATRVSSTTASTTSASSSKVSGGGETEALQTTENTSPESANAAEMRFDNSHSKVSSQTEDDRAVNMSTAAGIMAYERTSLPLNGGHDALPDAEPQTQDFDVLGRLDESIENAGSGTNRPHPVEVEQVHASTPTVLEAESASITAKLLGREDDTGTESSLSSLDSNVSWEQISIEPQSVPEKHSAVSFDSTLVEKVVPASETAQLARDVSTSSASGKDETITCVVDDEYVSDTQPQLPTNASTEFSLKGMLQRFVPLSPWAKLPTLRRSLTPSPALPATADNDVDNEKASTLDVPITDMDTSEEQLAPSNPPETGTIATETPEAPVPNDNQVPASSSPEPSAVVASSAVETKGPSGSTDAIEQTEMADVTDTALISLSQQSPWAKSQLSQLALGNNQMMSLQTIPVSTSQRTSDDSLMVSPEVQTPWATEIDTPAPMKDRSGPLLDERDAILPDEATRGCSTGGFDGSAAVFCTPALPARQATPEPQFTVKSFASFMSPSPQRPRPLSRPWSVASRSRLSNTRGILSSGVKSRHSLGSPRRVSWAPLPGDTEEESDYEDEHSKSTPLTRSRPASPPPKTPVADLPASEDLKFRNHFTAVAGRTNVPRNRLLPTSSQQTIFSPAPQAMAETFIAADEMRRSESVDNNGANEREEVDEPQSCDAEEPLETQDLIHEVFEDMAGFLESFDVDAELTQARKAEVTPAALGLEKTAMLQSP